MNRLVLSTGLAVLLSACANSPPAPVIDRGTSVQNGATKTAEARPGYYVVKKGDTLYSIALDHGQAYRDVAAWNNIDNPSVIKVGQSLRIAPPQDQGGVITPIRTDDVAPITPIGNAPQPITPTPMTTASSMLKQEPKGGKQVYTADAWARVQNANATAPAPAPTQETVAAAKPAETAAPAEKPAGNGEVSDWVWPTAGKVSVGFAEGSSKGIDIPAKMGQPVYAAGDGTVTLVSNAVRGYGNLVVIKHSQTLLSVYAHNSKVLVEEKQTVTKGQKIAEVGATDTDSPKLHFEIRRMGKPVDPLKFLPPH